MPSHKQQPSNQKQDWTFSWLASLVERNPLMLSGWVLCWAFVGIVSGLFAALYLECARAPDLGFTLS